MNQSFIHSVPFPLWQAHIFISATISLFLFCYICTFFIGYLQMTTYRFVFDFLFSLSISFRSFHVVTNDTISSFLMGESLGPLIQLSDDGWGSALSLLVLPESEGLLATSKRNYAHMHLPGQLWAGPWSLRQAAADPCLRRGPSDTHRPVLLSLSRRHCSFPLGPGVHQALFVPSESLCFPQSYGNSVIKPHCPSESDSLRIPSPFAGS